MIKDDYGWDKIQKKCLDIFLPPLTSILILQRMRPDQNWKMKIQFHCSSYARNWIVMSKFNNDPLSSVRNIALDHRGGVRPLDKLGAEEKEPTIWYLYRDVTETNLHGLKLRAAESSPRNRRRERKLNLQRDRSMAESTLNPADYSRG